MFMQFTIQTEKEGMYNITGKVRQAIAESGVQSGLCVVFCQHTTAGITINENADADVPRDILFGLNAAFPDRPEFRHAEGNAAAHIKASCIGASETLIVEKGAPLLGTWQGIWFCEFDGPRNRRYFVKVTEG